MVKDNEVILKWKSMRHKNYKRKRAHLKLWGRINNLSVHVTDKLNFTSNKNI